MTHEKQVNVDDSKSQTPTVEKTESIWHIECQLISEQIVKKLWTTTQWQLKGFNTRPQILQKNVGLLELHRDERTDYRFNLNSQMPKLFVVLENLDDESLEESSEANVIAPNIVTLTASQSVAGQYMDGDYLVLSDDMPLAVQAWMEAYIGRHGELIEVRRKKRKGAGRASGN
ncbi:DUF3305 domain-containing protein [Vibrio genomosp. F6]|uniref:DUF3305 domain-containing protein n=1 Tax=Vibrio genomosp. F6 TaxID=723172 RepID=UPI0010BDEC93|nr:DUF3305 domain-containing protein [Vibrio genomosp. F6]TKF22319.1 DUF3305 domain-containing protein [Vibrio genomosp. F6]